jgi:DNA-binding MarR family transcriptional regulator
MGNRAKPKAARRTLDLGALGDFVGFRVRLAQIRVFRDFERSLAELGVTPASFSVLEVLRANPGATQTRLANAVHLDRSSVVPLLDKLEQRGLLRREASTTDRRNNHLYLSAQGVALLAAAMARVREHEQRMTGRLSVPEKKLLVSLLGRIGE